MGGSRRAAAASGHASSETTPQQPANATVKNEPPKAAFLSVNLTEVEGANAGGQVHLINLGVPVADVRWQMDRPGATGTEGRRRAGGCSPGAKGEMGTVACAGETRWDTRVGTRRGWDPMVVTWTVCWASAVR